MHEDAVHDAAVPPSIVCGVAFPRRLAAAVDTNRRSRPLDGARSTSNHALCTSDGTATTSVSTPITSVCDAPERTLIHSPMLRMPTAADRHTIGTSGST